MRLATSLPVVMYVAVLTACGHAPVATAPVTTGTPPAELRIPGLDEHRNNPRFLADRIYVLGRSATRIAYVKDPADEACGCYTPEIVVLDLTTNDVVWKDSYDSGELDPKNTSQLKNLDQLWRARGADWEHHIAEHGVTLDRAAAMHAIPTGGAAIPRVEIRSEKVGESSPEGYAHLTAYSVDLVSSSATTLIAMSRSPVSEYNLLDVSVLGYVPLLGDPRVAVLVLEERRGWEGTPTVMRLRFVGADIHDALR